VLRSPLEPHVATPRELRSRLQAERRGSPFLVYRDAGGDQAIVTLDEFERLTIGRRPGNEIALEVGQRGLARARGARARRRGLGGRRRRPFA
jgi:hypothetical protein